MQIDTLNTLTRGLSASDQRSSALLSTCAIGSLQSPQSRRKPPSKRKLISQQKDLSLGSAITRVGAERRGSTLGNPYCDSNQDASSGSGRVGDVNRYSVTGELGHGGCGIVHRASDRQLDREVAIKKIAGPTADDPLAQQRFFHEAKITGQLQHPGIVPVHELGANGDGEAFYVMKLLQGETLRAMIRQQHQALAAQNSIPDKHSLHQAIRPLLDRFVDVCHTIAYAHDKGVIHRDLKPANVMVGPYGETVVVDWGLARTTSASQSLQQQFTPSEAFVDQPSAASPDQTDIVGTPAYMSPEQACGDRACLHPTSDIYSLGVMLYEIIAGEHPFHGCSAAEVLSRDHLSHEQSLFCKQPNASKSLAAICMTAMALQPSQRYSTASLLAEDIQCFLADSLVSVYREPLLDRLTRACRRHRTTAISIVSAGVVLLIASLLFGGVIHRAHQAEKKARLDAEAAHAITAHNLANAHAAMLQLAKSSNTTLSLQNYDDIDRGYRMLDQQSLLSAEDKLVWAEGILGEINSFTSIGQLSDADKAIAELRAILLTIQLDVNDVEGIERLQEIRDELSARSSMLN